MNMKLCKASPKNRIRKHCIIFRLFKKWAFNYHLLPLFLEVCGSMWNHKTPRWI